MKKMNLFHAAITELFIIVKIIGVGVKIIGFALKSSFRLNVSYFITFLIFVRIVAVRIYGEKYSEKEKFDKNDTLSLAFFAKKKMHSVPKFLFVCFVLCSMILSFLQRVTIIMPVLLFLFVVLVLIKDQLIEFRIKKGLFGTNRTEARELIDFIIKNSDNLDFTDSNGNLRRALLPEAKDAVEEHIPGTLGEEARA